VGRSIGRPLAGQARDLVAIGERDHQLVRAQVERDDPLRPPGRCLRLHARRGGGAEAGEQGGRQKKISPHGLLPSLSRIAGKG
jgi:hypothetical protein